MGRATNRDDEELSPVMRTYDVHQAPAEFTAKSILRESEATNQTS